MEFHRAKSLSAGFKFGLARHMALVPVLLSLGDVTRKYVVSRCDLYSILGSILHL